MARRSIAGSRRLPPASGFAFVIGTFFSLLFAFLPAADSQPISILYTCTKAELASCETQFRVCFTYKVSQIYMEVLCNCYANSYQCYSDCDALPQDFESRCSRQCPIDVCTPKLSPYAFSRAEGFASVSMAAVGVALAATLLSTSLR